MGNLILVRHGQSAGNRDRVFALNPHSLPLTALGYAQARAAAGILAKKYDAKVLISSPFIRAQETARTIADALQLPLTVEPLLYERDVGAHKGLSYDSLEGAADYDALRPWTWTPREGESYLKVQARVAPVLDRLAAEYPSQDVVIVSHGGVMMSLWAHVTGSWEAAPLAPNCGLIVVRHGPEGYGAPQINDGAALGHGRICPDP